MCYQNNKNQQLQLCSDMKVEDFLDSLGPQYHQTLPDTAVVVLGIVVAGAVAVGS